MQDPQKIAALSVILLSYTRIFYLTLYLKGLQIFNPFFLLSIFLHVSIAARRSPMIASYSNSLLPCALLAFLSYLYDPTEPVEIARLSCICYLVDYSMNSSSQLELETQLIVAVVVNIKDIVKDTSRHIIQKLGDLYKGTGTEEKKE